MVITCRYRQISWELLVSELQSLVGPEMRLHLGLLLSKRTLDCPALQCVTDTHYTSKHHGSIWLME